MAGKPGRPPKEVKDPLPPLLHGYWESEELRQQVEQFIVQGQAAGVLPVKNSRGKRYWVIHFVMDAVKEKLARDVKTKVSTKPVK